MMTDKLRAEADEHRPENWPLGRLLGAASRTVERAWADALEARGLTHAGLIVLHLLDSGFDSQADLARIARVEAQTMSRTVDRLVREAQDALRRAAHERFPEAHAEIFLTAGHPDLGGVRPIDYCRDPVTLRTCLTLLPAKRGRRVR